VSALSPEDLDERRRHRALEQRHRARRELQMFARRLAWLLAALVVLVIAGSVAFTITEGVSLAYGLVWTLDTVTTLGSIQDPHSAAGRVVVVGLEVFGIGTLFYGLATVAEFFVSGQLSGLLDERRSQRMIDSYFDHVIVCGFGRVGRQVSRDLTRAGVPHVAIDAEAGNREPAASMGVTFIESYAADDEVLLGAGIERARAVIACVDSDADNIFIALTARELAPDVLIVARASADDVEKKLRPLRPRARRWRGWRCTPRSVAPSRSPTTAWRRSTSRGRVPASAPPWRMSGVTRWSSPCATMTGALSPSRRPTP
jgi:hypothetical protein